jgi:hypothetical protein
MRSLRWRTTGAGLLATAVLGLMAQPAAAIHQGATLDCGSAGTYTIEAVTTPAGLYPPGFTDVVLLGQDGKKVGVLVPFEYSRNGGPWILLVGDGAIDGVGDNVGFTTCSFTGSNGDYFVLVGLLNLH